MLEILRRVLKDSRYECLPEYKSGASRNIPPSDIVKILVALALYFI